MKEKVHQNDFGYKERIKTEEAAFIMEGHDKGKKKAFGVN